MLGLAHECVPETVTKSDGEKITFFQGPSPDEVTLVDFAKSMGLDFQETDDKSITAEFNGPFEPVRKMKYEVFRRIEFSSKRKRMSILLKDPDDGLVKLYVKGADSEIIKRLDKD